MTSNIVPGADLMGPEGVDARLGLSSQEEAAHMDQELFDRDINSLPLEVYMYYADIERERENNDSRPVPDAPWTVLLKTLTGQRHRIVRANDTPPEYHASPNGSINGHGALKEKAEQRGEVTVGAPVSDDAVGAPMPDYSGQKESAYRLLRTASWQIVFYLITTDILGFSSSPIAFAQLGYGPGMLVYTFFFLLAFCSGQILWRIYLSTDSEQYPVTCYADIGERMFGRFVRHIFNVLQSLQLIFNVAILIIGNGQTLAAIIKYKFCYIALNVFWAIAGILVGQIKSLRNFAWFTNINIYLNLIVMGITMAGIAIFEPVPSQSNHKDLSEPVKLYGWVPEYTVGWYQQVSGVQYAVFAYGGAMIFTEFMAEMRRPRDFWKAAFCAQLFCYLMYIFFGLFCYSHQGQYSSILPSLNFNNTALQLVCNIISLVSTGVACVLYANIGLKVFYHNVLRAYFKAPPLTTRAGSINWSISVFVYWAIAWVIGSAIPNISALVTLIGAVCILQFTYTFPPLLLLGWWMQRDAIKGDRPWEPGMEPWTNRTDTWRNLSRWKRGFKPHWYAKTFLFLLFLAALSLCALGIYAGVEGAIEAYATDATTAFSCRAPGQPQ